MIGGSTFVATFGIVPPGDDRSAKVARAACNAGYAVLVLRPGTKVPLCTLPAAKAKAADRAAQESALAAGRTHVAGIRHECGVVHALTDPAEAYRVVGRLAKRHDGVNLAVVPGAGATRMVAVDVDTAEENRAFLAAWSAETNDADMPMLTEHPTVRSPGSRDEEGNWTHRDGGHYWFTVPDGVRLPTAVGKMPAHGGWVAYWGDRNYLLVPPSVREEGAYELVGDVQPAPGWLLDRIILFGDGYTERRRVQLAKAQDSDDPIERWGAATPWGDLLTPAGWTDTGDRDSCGCPIWTAPGDHANPKSATAHEPGCTWKDDPNPALHIWTDNPPYELAGVKTWSKLSFYAAMWTVGPSVSAAMAELGLEARHDGAGGVAFGDAGIDQFNPADIGLPAAAAVQEKPGDDDPFALASTSESSEDGDVESYGSDGDSGGQSEPPARPPRLIDLGPYLDGSYVAPEPSLGAARDDGVRMLYPGKWHTVIGLTTAGKSWLALYHVVAEILAGRTVVYMHFEEASPAGTLDRLSSLGLTMEQIMARFVWLDASTRWKSGEYAAYLDLIRNRDGEDAISLVVLDGINAACSMHAWPVDKPEGVGAYRAGFVTPAAVRGAAVVSLGHPPKARDRQEERHSYGSTAWLDEVDGASYRLTASDYNPIRKGHAGGSAVYVVKDRSGSVDQHCRPASGREPGTFYFGQFTLDSSAKHMGQTAAELFLPGDDEQDGQPGDGLDKLGDEIVRVMADAGGRFGTVRELLAMLRAAGVKFRKENVEPALFRLDGSGRLLWPPAGRGRSRPGRLAQLPDESGDSSDGDTPPSEVGVPGGVPPV